MSESPEPSAAPDLTPAPDVPLFIVGVGASAGGLEALSDLFANIPRTGSLAFVVVQHLSPDFKSLMDELLGAHTSLTVTQAQNGTTVEADGVYLMPPGTEMIISGGKLLLTERDSSRGLSLPIDGFLRSLAEDVGTRSVAIILSGTGSDGSRGLRSVHEAGGLVIAQSVETAKFDGMPRAAIDTGDVDLVLAPAAMSDALQKHVAHDVRLSASLQRSESSDVMTRIFELLKAESGVEFGDYKPSTVGRRIERRVLLSDSPSLQEYLARLDRQPDELRSLYRDLLVGVTAFFRDGDAFDHLRAEITALVGRLAPDEEMRVWVAACATGEEAYSVAMLASEAFLAARRPVRVRVFATDVHRASLEVASNGLYTEAALAAVAPDLRERYFERTASGYQVGSDLRSRVVFAHHNVLRDAPFTRLDLLTCRNFLIYLKQHAQRRVLSLFHFALKTGGLLMLGPSESTGPLADEFATVDGRWKLFRKTRELRLAPDLRESSGEPGTRRSPPRARGEDVRVAHARERLMERYAPPTFLVDDSFRLLHSWGGAGDFLSQRDGAPSLNLLDILQGELKYIVGAALKRAQKEKRAVEYTGVLVRGDDRRRVVAMPVNEGDRVPGDGGWMVSLELEPATTPPREQNAQPATRADDERIATLERDLKLSRENLQSTLEEMEAGNEELQATNEELIASNEELQSTNEELHSVNEELHTVNAEYQSKIAELTEMASDINHLLEATEVHTIFLDGELRVRRFTPKVAALFNLLGHDIGRRLDAFAHDLDDLHLVRDLNKVNREGGVVQREVADRNGHSFLLRILPYRPSEAKGGVVLTLIDVTAVKRAQQDLAIAEQRYRTLIRAVAAVLFTTDSTGRFTAPQPEWEAYTGQAQREYLDFGWQAALHEDDRARVAAQWSEAVREVRVLESEGRLWSAQHREHRHFLLRAAPILEAGVEGPKPREWVGHIIDVHDAKLAELEAQRKTEQLRAIVANAPVFISVKDIAGKYLIAGRQAEALFDRPAADIIGKTDHDLWPVGLADEARARERRALETGATVEGELEIRFEGRGSSTAAPETGPDDEAPRARTFLFLSFPLREDGGRPYAMGTIAADITDRKRAVEEAREAVERRDRFLAMLSHELRTPLGAILNASHLLGRYAESESRPAGARESPPARDPRTPHTDVMAVRDIIDRQSRHMAKLIDDLLDVGRITRDQLVIEQRLLDLRDVISDAAETVRGVANSKGLILRVEVPRESVPVLGDAVRLRQIVTNLISNAVSYTPSGSIKVEIHRRDKQVAVSVTDTGVGLEPDELGRVFELFYQAPQSIDRPRGGLGVGLSLAQQLARLHGGRIEGASAGKGQGATFTLTLPLSDRTNFDRTSDSYGRTRSGQLRIVLVEDNEDNRVSLTQLLELQGHQVIAASNGIDGVEIILKNRPDVALVDVGLPGLDGHAVARKVRATIGSDTRLIALTGYARKEDSAAAIAAGFDRHIVKPVEPRSLMRVLDEVVSRSRQAS